jgi:hypothetical protein
VRAVTCCVGLEHDGSEVWIGGDSASVLASKRIEVVTERKVWKTPGWVFGFAGSWRAGALVKLLVKPPSRPRDVDAYLKIDFVRACRAACHGEPEAELDGLYLLAGHGGRLYQIEPGNGTVTRSQYGYAAVGATGALEALAATATVTRPRARLLRVLHAVARHSVLVRAPFHVEHA